MAVGVGVPEIRTFRTTEQRVADLEQKTKEIESNLANVPSEIAEVIKWGKTTAWLLLH